MLTTIEQLIPRARRRCMEKGDYWWDVEQFLRQICQVPAAQLNRKQSSWLSAIRSDLREPGDL